jgi:hypothetical protein
VNSARRVSSSSGRGASKLPPLNFRLRSRTSFLVLHCSIGCGGSSAAGATSCRRCRLHEPVAKTFGLVVCNTPRTPAPAEGVLHIYDLLRAVPHAAVLSVPEHSGKQWPVAVGGPAVSLGPLLQM